MYIPSDSFLRIGEYLSSQDIGTADTLFEAVSGREASPRSRDGSRDGSRQEDEEDDDDGASLLTDMSLVASPVVRVRVSVAAQASAHTPVRWVR
jgi:hypothetical protein